MPLEMKNMHIFKFVERMLLLGNIAHMSVVIWSGLGFTVAEDEVVGCYLVRSRFHGNLLEDEIN